MIVITTTHADTYKNSFDLYKEHVYDPSDGAKYTNRLHAIYWSTTTIDEVHKVRGQDCCSFISFFVR